MKLVKRLPKLPAHSREAVEQELTLDFLDMQIESAEQRLEAIRQVSVEADLLKTLPCVGPILSMVLMLEIGRLSATTRWRYHAIADDHQAQGLKVGWCGTQPPCPRRISSMSKRGGTHENIFVLGPTGVGKSFVACALAQKAYLDGYSALYTHAQSLFRDLAMARADGSLRGLLARLSRIDVLVIDDWAMAPLSEPERRDFWEICEDRYQVRSTLLTSQLPVSRWHEQIGDPTLAGGILDCLVHNPHRTEMRGDSMRKNRGRPNG